MPIYEYECDKCGTRVEHWQKMSDPPLSTCESCGGDMHKVISQTTFHLKGSGWYVTDYANKKQGGGKAESSSKKEGSSKNGSACKSGSCKSSDTSS